MTEKVIHIGDPETKEVIPVTFVNIDDATIKEAANYYGYVKEKVSTPIKAIKVALCADGMVDVSYDCEGAKFERIRRITGYLTGDLNTWNNSKQAEESERVQHAGRGCNFCGS